LLAHFICQHEQMFAQNPFGGASSARRGEDTAIFSLSKTLQKATAEVHPGPKIS
jgi:hypothetical protein